MADERWLAVGLGNPVAEYEGTRHNVGADTVRLLAAREHATLARNKRVRSEVAEVVVAGVRFVLAVPMTYMNRSGDAVQAAVAWYKVPLERLVVCHDDLDVAMGAVRLKRGGGPGGHNGLRDVDRALGSRDYLRVRIGIGRPPGRMPSRDYVLRRFQPAEHDTIAVTLEHAADAIVMLATDGLERSQNTYHANG